MNRKIIKTSSLPWDVEDALKQLLNVSSLPYLLIIEGVEDE